MFGIFAKSFGTATRSTWDAPQHWKEPRYPRSGWDREREIAEARRRAMKTIGMW